AIRGRGAGLEADLRFTRAGQKDVAAARAGEAADRDRLDLAVIADGGTLRGGVRVAALEPVVEDLGDLAADTQRRVGARDQERAREAAGDRGRVPGWVGAGSGIVAADTGNRSTLRDLVEPLLEELVVGAEVRYLIGLRGGHAGQQRDYGGD